MGLLDHLGVEGAVLGGLSLGANVSLFAAAAHPERVQGLVLEMPVLEWAVPSAALAFVPMLLAAHYGARVMRFTSAAVRRLPRTPWGPVNSLMHAGSLPPEVMAAILHGVLVGPVAPTLEARLRIKAPTLVLAHSNDLIHPFSDAVNLVNQLPNARMERARSPVELRLFPERLTGDVPDVLEIRGEIYLPIAEWRALNEEQERQGLARYVNPRNTAAGDIAPKDAPPTATEGTGRTGRRCRAQPAMPARTSGRIRSSPAGPPAQAW